MTMAITGRERLRVTLHGTVQGFGFRPTVYRMASSLRLGGWVRNMGDNLEIEVEGSPQAISQFLLKLETGRPKEALVETQETLRVTATGGTAFEILPSVDPRGSIAQIATSVAAKSCEE